MRFQKVTVARRAVELTPRAAAGMTVGPEITEPEPAPVVTTRMGTKGLAGIDLTKTSMRWRHGVGWHGRRCLGMHGVSLTQGTMRLVGQPLEGFRLMRTVALGFERLGFSRCGRSAHAWRGPGEVQHNQEPDECEDDQLREKKRRHHGIAPSNRCCDEGILPGFGGNGIIRRVRAHDRSTGWWMPVTRVIARAL